MRPISIYDVKELIIYILTDRDETRKSENL